MAGIITVTSILAFIFQNILFASASDKTPFCWHGDIEYDRTLKNESCATGKLSPPDVRDSKTSMSTHSPVGPPHVHDSKTSMSTHSPLLPQNLTQVTSGPAVSETIVNHCMVFQYVKHTELGAQDNYKTYETSIYANYTCDYSGVCHRLSNGWHHNVTYKGIHGNVYCCDTNNCNNNISGVLPHQQLCYEASNSTPTPTGTSVTCSTHSRKLLSCMASIAFCARSTWVQLTDGRKISSFYCDTSNKCQKYGLTGKHSSCKTVRRENSNETEELCCCSESKCFVPPWPLTEEFRPNTESSDTLQWVIAGTIILLTFCIGVTAGVVVAVVRNRTKARRDNHMAMTYRRIAAEDGVGNGDDEHLIT